MRSEKLGIGVILKALNARAACFTFDMCLLYIQRVAVLVHKYRSGVCSKVFQIGTYSPHCSATVVKVARTMGIGMIG